MKLLVVADSQQLVLTKQLQDCKGRIQPVNSRILNINSVGAYLDENPNGYDVILVTDEGMGVANHHNRQAFLSLLERSSHVSSGGAGIVVLILTRNYAWARELEGIHKPSIRLCVYHMQEVRLSQLRLQEAISRITEDKPQKPNSSAQGVPKREEQREEIKRKPSFLERFRPKDKGASTPEATDRLTRELENLSRGISRIIGITGHRGSGVTSTAVNLAYEASKRGLSAIIIDLDTQYRSMNMYVSSFHEATRRDEELNASLIHTLARPQDYKTTSFSIQDQLWVSSLGYSFVDRKLMDQFVNASRLIGLLSVLRNKFNIILLDIPVEALRAYTEAWIHVDVFGLCVPNNLHAVLSTVRDVEVGITEQVASYLNAKAKLVITNYNERSRFHGDLFTPEKVGELLASGLSERLRYEMKVAGHILHSPDFDMQIETDIPITNTGTGFDRQYGQLLLRLMEGS